MAAGGGAGARDLDKTPTWAVAGVCAVIIIISIFLEKLLHRLGEWFTAKHKKALFEALEKVKSGNKLELIAACLQWQFDLLQHLCISSLSDSCFSTELMILGFISLLLTFGQNYIAKICLPEKVADTMLPCRLDDRPEDLNGVTKRRLLWDSISIGGSASTRRSLAAASVKFCPQGKVSFVSVDGLHQLHIFIFFLAIFHVTYSALTMALGRLKIRRWKEWEKETLSPHYEFSNDPSRFRLAHETSFVCFFHQFFSSVRKSDYLTLRNGFINVHLAPGSRFNFQKYIKRSLEDDYKVVVGISPILWACAVIFLLLNVHGWQELFWVSLTPPIILLAVGTKLQAIIAKMAIAIKERHAVVQGIPLVQLSDSHFWFGRPQLVLSLIHFTLFMNTFQLTYFFWIWYQFGLKSCFHKNFKLIIARVSIGVALQFMCSYITLPLYALVSQMGSHMKRSIFDEQTNRALKKWHQAVRKRHKKGTSCSPSVTSTTTPRTSPSSSPVHLLHSYQQNGHSDHFQSRNYSDQENDNDETVKNSKRFSVHECSETDCEHQTMASMIPSFKHREFDTQIIDEIHMHVEEGHRDEDFTFVKPPPSESEHKPSK
ncbi:MLO-like protein 5 [Apostasia shenzhenica]|uniref:MLO-like protein n=1 Tax=Apostasia shenzhenica TaxID=1088818 RepID=A0A2H9ZXX2_9ASPA|nr:MLO-like protein 5 [Apostasia shenzhenica]